MEMNRFIFCLIILSIFGLASSKLKNPSVCGISICEPHTKFNYSTNSKYVYDYNVEIASLFRGASENRSALFVKASVQVTFSTPCQGNLRVSDVLLSWDVSNAINDNYSNESSSHHPNEENFAQALSRYPLRFNFNDGNIDEICPHEKEPVWVLNFKRGILSAFHTTMTRFDIIHEAEEMDVNGICRTKYQLNRSKNTALIIQKVKKLDTCSSRYDYHTIIQSNPYKFGSDIQTIPLVKSRNKCELTIDRKIYTGIECEEVHTFQPFSKGENGSQTIIRQSLLLSYQGRGSGNLNVPDDITRRTTLLFDHSGTPKPTSGDNKAARELIKTLCELHVEDVQEGYSKAFAKFIQTARRLSYSALVFIYNRAESICSTGRKHVTDAFNYLGSNAAVKIIVDNIMQNKVPQATAHEWLISISFIPKPDEETVELVVPLINHPNARNESQYLFVVSSLMYRYCKYNSSCEKNEHVQRFLEFIKNEVTQGCGYRFLDREEETKMLIILKSLGNLGLTTAKLENQIKECIENYELNMNVRVAAAQSHRRLSCIHKRDYYLDIYRNASYDTEVRIASYLEVMRCPTYSVTNVVRKALEDEEVNQVGSFVWSHLNNLIKSSALNKVEIQSLLTDKHLSEKFNKDGRKFSGNYELSIFLKEYNVGGSVESNLIFSPKSYIPRSGMLNLTVDLFGRSINVFEMDVTLEGFEHVLEYGFGPEGPFSSTEVGKIIHKATRFIRDVGGEEPVKPAIDFPNVIKNNFKLPKLGVAYKVFGNEIFYSDTVGHPEFNTLIDSINPSLKIKQILSGEEINFKKAGMFLDVDYIIPSGIGFPVTLTGTGTAAVSLNMAGNFKSLHLLALDVKGKLRPSVAIDITGQMGIDAYYASTGIKLKTSLYSSTALDGQVKVEGTTFAKVSFNLPKEKAEIITAQSELIVLNRDKEEIQSGITENRVEQKVCSWPKLDETLGLKLCADFFFPNATKYLDDSKTGLRLIKKPSHEKTAWPSFILNGPAKFSLALYKADPTAKEYVLQYNWVDEKDMTTISLVYDTPNSEKQRELSARLQLNNNSKNLTLSLRALNNKFEAYGKYKYTPNEKYFDFSMDYNGKKHFMAQIGLRTTEVRHGCIYQPKLYLEINEERVTELSGIVKITEKHGVKHYDVDLKFNLNKLSTELFGFITKDMGSSSFLADFKLYYQFNTKEYIKIKLEWNSKSLSKNSIDVRGDFSLDTSSYKQYNFISSLEFKRIQGRAECAIEINTKPVIDDEAHKLNIKLKIGLVKSYEHTLFSTSVEVKKPINRIDLNLTFCFEMNHYLNGDKSTTNFNLKYATGKEILARLDLLFPRSELFKMTAKVNVTLPTFVPMLLIFKIEEKKSRYYDFNSSITWFSGHEVKAKGIYIDRSEGVVTSHSLKLLLTSPSFNDVNVLGKLLLDDSQLKIEGQVDHNEENYAILFKHMIPSPMELDLYAEIRYKSSLYSLTTLVNLMKQRQVLVELHLDQHRDIQITFSGVNIPTHKQMGVEVKWDANRDPTQRFLAEIRFQHPRSLNYSGGFLVSYPGRDVKGMALFASHGTSFESSASVLWSPTEAIDVKIGAVYQNVKGVSLNVTSQLLTPFPRWKRTSVNAGIYRENNLVRLNGIVWWQDNQTVSLDIFGDYELFKKKSSREEDEDYSDFDLLLRPDIPDLWVEFRASLISTVPEVKPMGAAFKHKQNNNHFDTLIYLKGQSSQHISINSTWELIPSSNSTDIAGKIYFLTPYKGYEKGHLKGLLHYTIDLDIHGVAEMNLDRKKYEATMNGYLKSIRDNMLIVDVTTPIETYSKITGKLGYSEVQRHLMCIWESPTNSVGLEILFDFQNTANFNLKFLIATPIEFFSKLLLRGMLKAQMVDFKVGLNNLLLGFDGYWIYVDILDLDYKYTLYTPLEGFKENGVVARIKYYDNIDVELGLKIAEIKFGALVLWRSKTTKIIDFKPEEEEEEEHLKYEGHIKLDTHFYPTILGNLDIDQEDDIYTVKGNLILPNGTIHLYDELVYEDILTVFNKLILNTSYAAVEKVTSELKWLIMMGEYHIVEFRTDVLTYDQHKQGQLKANYTIEFFKEDSPQPGRRIHYGIFRLDTPWKEFQLLDIKGTLETLENKYKTNVLLFTNQSYFSGNGTLEIEDGFIEATLGMYMTSPTYKIPEFMLTAKRELTVTYKNVEIILVIEPPISQMYYFEWLWRNDSSHFEFLLKLNTPWKYLESNEIKTSYVIFSEGKKLKTNFGLIHYPDIEIEFAGLKQDKILTLEGSTPVDGFRKIRFEGSLIPNENNAETIFGILNADEVSYDIDGIYEISDENPLTVKLSLRPQAEGVRTVTISVSVLRITHGQKLHANIAHGQNIINAIAKYERNPENTYILGAVIDSTYPEINHIDANVRIIQAENGTINLEFAGFTPWELVETVHASASYLKLERTGRFTGNLKAPKFNSYLDVDYTWSFMEHMQLLYNAGYTWMKMDESKYIKGEAYYKNPGKNLKYLTLGVDSDVGGTWLFGVNGTLHLPKIDDIKVGLNLKLPPPESELHSLVGKLRYSEGFSYLAHTLKYTNEVGRAIYGSSGEVNHNGSETTGNLKLEWGNEPNAKAVTNVFHLTRREDLIKIQYNLHTPYHAEDTVLAKFISAKQDYLYNVKAHLYSPKSRLLSFGDVRFASIHNMNGSVNTTTPFKQLSYVGSNFDILTEQANRSKRYVEIFWSNNTAFLDSDYYDIYTQMVDGLTRKVNGKLLVEIPLATRHIGDVTYGYEEVPLKAFGFCMVDYNKKRLLDGKYNCDSESRAGFDKDVVDISVENVYLPLGVHYVRQFEYSGGNEGTNYPTVDKKTADVFQLNNRTNFNLKGILEVKTTHTGKDIKMTAIHANKTVHLDTNYHFLDHEFKHASWIKLDPQVWSSYDLHIINKTVVGQDEEHGVLNIAYPKRNFTVTGFFRSSKQHHESEVKLDWDRPDNPKTLGAGAEWWRVSKRPDQQVLTISFKHPSFAKDVTFNGTYIRHGTKSLFTKLDVEYSSQLRKKLTLEGEVKDLSTPVEKKYTMNLLAKHPKTNLDFYFTGEVYGGYSNYRVDTNSRYQRSFLARQNGIIHGEIKIKDKEIDLHKISRHEESYLKAKFVNEGECCSRLNGTIAKTNELNYTGDFFIDVDEKILEFLVNMTPDAEETFHASGRIPDARNAHLNIWRDYDDITISDLAFYLKLNHSRLITSKLKWRQKLAKEVLTGIEQIYSSSLKNIEDTIEYWKSYTRSEIKEAVQHIWRDAKYDIQEFLNEMKELESLEEDFEKFKQFINDSYNNNDFYIKDITGRIVVLIDELALTGHVQSLPDILNEIWQVMGESGEAIKSSIVWIIETVKTSYSKAMDLLKGFLHGDSTEQISALVSNILDKYDKMVKDLRGTVVRHLEHLWSNFTNMITEYWEFFIKSVKPTLIKFLHYAETVFLQASSDVMNFLYASKAELSKSPYFAKLSNFSADFEVFFRDITKNRTISNLKKYGVKAYQFIKEKWFNTIPFGKEIEEFFEEIINGIKELEKLPSVNYVVTTSRELYDKFVWFWNSYDLESKTQTVVSLIYSKIWSGSESALEADNQYRKPKTNFVFDVDEGLVLLEQKLPMSWHAFNETPKFEEIPEYRTIAEFQKHMSFFNNTFWTFYQKYKPYTEILNWLPPFKAQAIIAGNQFFMTFDKTFYEFRGPCDYLLAHDFVDKNFSLSMTKDSRADPDHFLLILTSHDFSVSVDMFNDTVKIPGAGINSLPFQYKNLYIYKEQGVITLEEIDSYSLKCNVLFKVCSLTLSGWFFGKTAGLLGTMDNEITTDFLTSDGHVEPDIGRFAYSWALNKEKCESAENHAQVINTINDQLFNVCASLFKSKNSQFSTCFNKINPAPFMTMCLNDNNVKDDKKVCTAAVAYVVACGAEYSPLLIPDFCVTCEKPDGKVIPEGQYFELSRSEIPKSTDIVFIVEAKECNKDMFTLKNMGMLQEILFETLKEWGFTDNRFAVVVFGGDGVLDQPKTLLLNGNVFTTYQHSRGNIWSFPLGNGTEHIFEAIAFASRLKFRLGVSKVFIAIPCSKCDFNEMTIEHSDLREVLIDGNIILHTLINGDFGEKSNKNIYGIDATKAYTKKDFNTYSGDSDLRRKAKLSRSTLGYCAPLALETSGTIFSAKFLESTKKRPVKKFASVFATRLADSALPDFCKKCECSRYDSGMSYIDCHPCEYQTPLNANLCSVDEECDFEIDKTDDQEPLMHPDEHNMYADGTNPEIDKTDE